MELNENHSFSKPIGKLLNLISGMRNGSVGKAISLLFARLLSYFADNQS